MSKHEDNSGTFYPKDYTEQCCVEVVGPIGPVFGHLINRESICVDTPVRLGVVVEHLTTHAPAASMLLLENLGVESWGARAFIKNYAFAKVNPAYN